MAPSPATKCFIFNRLCNFTFCSFQFAIRCRLKPQQHSEKAHEMWWGVAPSWLAERKRFRQKAHKAYHLKVIPGEIVEFFLLQNICCVKWFMQRELKYNIKRKNVVVQVSEERNQQFELELEIWTSVGVYRPKTALDLFVIAISRSYWMISDDKHVVFVQHSRLQPSCDRKLISAIGRQPNQL